jgi:hypothetical protein
MLRQELQTHGDEAVLRVAGNRKFIPTTGPDIVRQTCSMFASSVLIVAADKNALPYLR